MTEQDEQVEHVTSPHLPAIEDDFATSDSQFPQLAQYASPGAQKDADISDHPSQEADKDSDMAEFEEAEEVQSDEEK